MFKICSRLFILFIISLLFLTAHLFNPPTIAAETIIFQDDFNDNNIGDVWEVKNYDLTGDGSYGVEHPLSISEEEGVLKISGQGTNNNNWFGRSLVSRNSFNFTDKIQVSSDVVIPSQVNGSVVHLTIEFDASNRIVASLGQMINNTTKAAHLAFEENSVNRVNFPATFFEYDNNTILRLRLIFDPQTKLASFYIGNTLINEDIYNSNVLTNPHVGIAATVRDTGSSIDAHFDNFKIFTTNGHPQNVLNVPDIKQYSEPWWSDEYDNASVWSLSNPTIKRWGCAMTSAVMILNFYGDNSNPRLLNDWLKANYGYNRNGGILWPAISKYSSLDPDIPTLEFSYLNYSDDLLKSEIDSGRPPFLKLINETYGGNHFITARGYDDGNIFINDPASLTNTNLQQANNYWGETSKLGRFKASETDLSYIVLFVDDGFKIKVSSKSGEIVGNEYYLKEGSFSDPDNPNHASGVESLSAFYYPKPESGFYQVDIQGNGDYQLDYFLYDEEGNVKTNSIFGIVSENETNSNLIKFNKGDYQESDFNEINFDSILGYWGNLHEGKEITNHGLYISIKQLIENALKNMEKGNGITSRVLLDLVLQKISFFTPEFISEETSAYLQKQIEILITSLDN